MKSLRLFERPGGKVKVYAPPEPNAEYLLGADVALGEMEKRSRGDRSAVVVLKRCFPFGLEQVFLLQERCEAGQLGEIIAAVGKYYNYAIINIERNLSLAPAAVLRRSGYPMDRWYVPPVMGDVREDEAKIYFYPKYLSTQKLLTDTTIDYLRQKHVVIRSKEIIDDLRDVTKDDRGHLVTRGRDLAVALMMAVIVDATTPRLPPPPPERPKAPRAPEGVDHVVWAKSHKAEEEEPPRDESAGWADVGGVTEAVATDDGEPDWTEPVAFGD